MTDVALLAGLTSAATALAALLAHEARAVYHDGLRLLVRDTGDDLAAHKALAREGWRMSAGFIAWFALPVSLMTGTLIGHIIFHPADLIGVRIRSRTAAVASGALYGATAALIIISAGAVVSRLGFGIGHVPHVFADTAVLFVPLVPMAAAVRLHPLRYGVASCALGVAVWLVAKSVGFDGVVWPMVAASIPLVAAASQSRPADVNLEQFAPAYARVRDSAPALLILAMVVGALGGVLFLAGDPFAAWLLFSGHPSGAAAFAVLTAVAFMPLVVTTAMSSGVYSTQGYPDWLLAPGYLVQNPALAAPLAGALMAIEIFGLRGFCRLVMRYPEISSVAATLRAGTEDVLALTGIVGGTLAAAGTWGDAGLYGLGAIYLANEASGRRVPMVAIGPVAVILLAIVRMAWGVIVG